MTEKENNIERESSAEGIAILKAGCILSGWNETLPAILGMNMHSSGKLCVNALAGEGECKSCFQGGGRSPSSMMLFTGERFINGKRYCVNFKKILYDKEGWILGVLRIMEHSAAESFYEKIKGFMKLYVSSLETVRVLPWQLNTCDMKLYRLFGDRPVPGAEIASVNFENWLELVFPEDRDRCMPDLAGFLDGSIQELNIAYRITDGRGNWRWLRTNANAVTVDESGRPLLINGYNLDITELKQYEEQNREKEQKLRDSESRLKNAMKLGRMSPWEYVFSRDRIITDRRLSEFWGYGDYYERKEPISREQLEKRVHAEDRPYVMERFNNAVSKGENFEMVFRIVVDDQVKYVHFIGEAVFENEKPVKLIGVAQDLTALRMLESDLEKKFEGLRFITERIGIGLWDFSIPDMTLCVMSNEYRLGKNEVDTLTISYESLLEKVHPDDVERAGSMFDSLLKGETDVVDFDFRFMMRADYNWFHVSAVINSRDFDGRPLSVRGLYQDITEKKDIENKLYQSQKMEAIGRLAGGVAHDFNNILQVILGYGSLALMDVDNESEMFEFISNIVDSGEKARNLVRQLLLFARREKFKPSLLSVNDLIGGLTMMLKRVIGENITLDFIPDCNLVSIYGDSGQLEQVVMNLCLNARDAVPGGGTVIIKTKDVIVDQPWPCFESTIPAGHYAMISVSDNGTGIAPENFGKIFEPFFTTKEKHKGTGLGLATVYSIVKQHGGFLDLHSIMGKGTTFTIYLPACRDSGETGSEDEKDISARRYSGRGTILVAEDDELIRRYTRRILTDSGFEVITACDGAEAVEQYNGHMESVDLLILDVIMPRKNGWDVYNSIVSNGNNIPVVFFSGYDENLLPGDFSSNKPMRYVQKPFKYYTLIKAIQELLEREKK